jgi:hypothetical protein
VLRWLFESFSPQFKVFLDQARTLHPRDTRIHDIEVPDFSWPETGDVPDLYDATEQLITAGEATMELLQSLLHYARAGEEDQQTDEGAVSTSDDEETSGPTAVGPEAGESDQVDRPSVHDWPGMAQDLKDRAAAAPHHAGSSHPAVMGMFARTGKPPVVASCTLDVHEQGFQLLHVAFSILGQSGLPPELDQVGEILDLFDDASPASYVSDQGRLHCLWPEPRDDEAAQQYVRDVLESHEVL